MPELDQPFTALEVQRAVGDLAPNKACGPDGLPNEFFKVHWLTLSPFVMGIFQQFFQESSDLSELNQANIVLVPKIETPTSVTDFRPISVINLIPKLISKVLANRLKRYIPLLVDEHQTTFIHQCYIAENFIATREVLHHVYHSKSPAILLKLDFMKAYDTLDWNFLLNAMAARGVPEKFSRWISHLLSTATSRIQINGQLSSAFKHNRGLRQGDPISPYLFILAADVLQKMTKALSSTLPHQLTSKLRHPIIMFQYADDTIVIVSTRGPTLRKLLLVIHCFTAASGLRVNFSKSSFVPLSITRQQVTVIERLIGCNHQSLPMNYLGMPLTIRPPRREDFMLLLQKLEKRLEGWRAKFISRAGRLQLVKTVLSAVPTYFMSCFAFPKWLLDRIDKIRRHFLWTRSQTGKSIHLVNWQLVCMPVQVGGMGVVNLHLQNISLLLRWLWRIFSHDKKLWGQYATALYGIRWTTSKPLILSKTGSYFWRSILKLKPLFNSCA